MVNREGDQQLEDGEKVSQIFASLAKEDSIGVRATRNIMAFLGKMSIDLESAAKGKQKAVQLFMRDTAFLETLEPEPIFEAEADKRHQDHTISDQHNRSKASRPRGLDQLLSRKIAQFTLLVEKLSAEIDNKSNDQSVVQRLNRLDQHLDHIKRVLDKRQQDQALQTRRRGRRDSRPKRFPYRGECSWKLRQNSDRHK